MSKLRVTRSQIQKRGERSVTVKAFLDVTENMTVVGMLIHRAELR